MGFWLKKFLTFWLMPLPLSLLGLLLGLLLLHSVKYRRPGQRLLLLSTLWLLLCSNNLFSNLLMRPLERSYPPLPDYASSADLPPDLASCRFIVVLGGGNALNPRASAVNQLSDSALSRLTEAVRLARLLPEAKLLLSGPSSPGIPPHAEYLRDAALSLGLAPERIQLITTARDTHEEAQATKALVGEAPVLLVTSAWHLPRAQALFRKQGVKALPCPADLRSSPLTRLYAFDFVLSSEALTRSNFALREYLGLLWSKLRGLT